MINIDRIPIEQPTPEQASGDRHHFPCICGIWRALPNGIRIGDVCELVPCIRCGSTPRLRFHGARVEAVDPTVPLTIVQGIRMTHDDEEAGA